MAEVNYDGAVRQVRAWIASGTSEDLRNAEDVLEQLRSAYPKRLPYIAAEVALLLAKGAPAEDCRVLVDYAVQEFHPQEGLSELFALKAETYPEGTPERRQLVFLSEFYASGVLPQREFAILDEMKARLHAGTMDVDGLHALAEQYYVTRNPLLSFVLMMAWCREMGKLEEYERHVLHDAGQLFPHSACHGNDGYLAHLLTDCAPHTFLVLMAPDDDDIPVLAMALRLLCRQVILLYEHDEIHAAQDVQAYAESCVQAAEAVGDEIHVTVGKCRTAAGATVDAVPAVIRLLARSIEQEAPLIVFSSDRKMAGLHEKMALAGDIQRLSGCLPSTFSYALAYAWTGSYLRYVSDLYGEPVEALLSAPDTCDFSIVIPVRNAADTLRHTLATCLAVDYAGDYEIVLSDNSDAGCTVVRELCEELNDSRIRYYRTPFPLSLDKSFEFAYLHARGAFIFSIGADDGVCPWALTYLRNALDEFPDEQIFSWARGFYSWPNLAFYLRRIIDIPLYDVQQSTRYARFGLATNREDIVRRVTHIFYSLPLLYINSGFRRSYLSEILHRTGRVLDGVSQDGYMSVVNLCLNDHVINIQCPLTIAGQSGHSVGAQSITFEDDLLREAKVWGIHPPVHAQRGTYVLRDNEWKIPDVPSADKIVFYFSVMRLRDMNVMETALDEEAVLDYVAQCIDLTDPAFERYYGLLLHAASLCSSSLHQKFLQRYARLCESPVRQERPVDRTVTPQVGYAAERGVLTLDADQFGCRTIADAVALTARILNL